MESKDTTTTALEAEPDNMNAPRITVSSSTTEMHQVLESGNSLEVVFNEDHLARKSGGLTSSSSIKTPQTEMSDAVCLFKYYLYILQILSFSQFINI